MPEAVSLPAAQVSPPDTGCQHQLIHYSQAEHLPGELQLAQMVAIRVCFNQGHACAHCAFLDCPFQHQ